MTTVLLTLGRLPKALDLARGFHALGCRVVVAEPSRWHMARMSRAVARCRVLPAPREGAAAHAAALAAVAAAEGADLVLPVSEEAMHASAAAPAFPARTRFASMGRARLVAAHDKLGFVHEAAVLGLVVPDTAPAGSADAEALIAAGRCVVKPRFSCSGVGVVMLERGQAPPPGLPGRIVQRRIEGPVVSSFSFAVEGRVVASVLYRAAVLSGSVAVAFERIEQASAQRFIDRFVEATRWSGFIAFDFVVDRDGVAVAIECNPRATSGLHFLDAAALARAVLDPRPDAVVPTVRARLMQQFYPTLTEGWARLLGRRGGAGEAFRTLLRARDVTFRLADPLPFLTMTATAWPIIRAAMAEGVSFGEVAMRDVAFTLDDFERMEAERSDAEAIAAAPAPGSPPRGAS
jgi:hypothetical protein